MHLHKRKLIIVAFAALLVIVLLTIYFIQNTYSSPSTHSNVINGLQLSLTLGAKTTTYKQGQTLNVTLALTNVGHQSINVSFDIPNPYFSFDVRDNKNNLVFTAEDSGEFNGTMTFGPERSIIETFYWDTAYRNNQVPVGVYQIVGFLVTENNGTSGFQTPPLNIIIVKGVSTNNSNQHYSSQH